VTSALSLPTGSTSHKREEGIENGGGKGKPNIVRGFAGVIRGKESRLAKKVQQEKTTLTLDNRPGKKKRATELGQGPQSIMKSGRRERKKEWGGRKERENTLKRESWAIRYLGLPDW